MQKILSTLRKAVDKYKLIENGDKIAVGLSGGKDSLVLLKALKMFQRFNIYNYEIIAVIIDIYSGNEDYGHLQKFCDELGVELIVEKTDIHQVVFEERKEKNPCHNILLSCSNCTLCAPRTNFLYIIPPTLDKVN